MSGILPDLHLFTMMHAMSLPYYWHAINFDKYADCCLLNRIEFALQINQTL